MTRSGSILPREAEEVDESGDHSETGEDVGQPRRRAEQLVHPPPPEVAESDGDRKHEADGRGLETLPELLSPVLFTFRHSGPPPHATRPTGPRSRPAGSAAG